MVAGEGICVWVVEVDILKKKNIIIIYKTDSTSPLFLHNTVNLIIRVIRVIRELPDNDITLIIPQIGLLLRIVNLARIRWLFLSESVDLGCVAITILDTNHIDGAAALVDAKVVAGHELDTGVGGCENRVGEITSVRNYKKIDPMLLDDNFQNKNKNCSGFKAGGWGGGAEDTYHGAFPS